MSPLALRGAWVASVVLAACAPSDPTSLFVRESHDEALALDQLRVTVTGGDAAESRTLVKPEIPSGALTSGQSVRLLLPDAWGGGDVTLRLEGMRSGQVLAGTEAVISIEKGDEKPIDLALQVAAPCSGCEPQRSDGCGWDGRCQCGAVPACEAGQRCAGGACTCDASSCAGCCEGGRCVTPVDVVRCGSGGAACEACDAARADRCEGGTCRCGTGPACALGQRCAGGQCVCDGSSCPNGCCEGSVCTTPSVTACGTAGAACASCDSLRADNCADGACRCGTGEVCAVGQRCAGGVCICDTASCSGCCEGATCHPGNALGACGTGGGACEACGSNASTCASGFCACGSGPACAPGTTCTANGLCLL